VRRIFKKNEPKELADFRSLPSSDDWAPSYDGLPGWRKKAILTSLMEEQRGLCCYCERRLSATNSHIEHFRPQSKFPELALDYGNMLCSCMPEIHEGGKVYCGMAKGDWFDDDLMVSPFDDGCEVRFAYGADGSVYSANPCDQAVDKTVEKLNLDGAKLRAWRKEVLDVFLSVELSDEDRSLLVEDYIRRDSVEHPSEFISAVKFVMRDWI